MAARLSFVEFDNRLKQGTLTAADHQRYLEVDPAAPLVRVRFKPGALRDTPPALYDVDRELYLAQRMHQERGLSEMLEAAVARKRVLAEGDSWFNLPPIVRPPAIADRLKSNGRVAVKNIAHWGHTLREILADGEFLAQIASYRPDFFIFGAGGNDMQESLARGEFVLPYDAARPIADCVSPQGEAVLLAIAAGFRKLMNDITVRHPNLACVFFAYDYPRPTFKGGKYIGRHLKNLGYPPNKLDAVCTVIIDRLMDTIKPVVTAFPNGQFLDCRRVTASHPFYDDMHPGKDGFIALAHKYEQLFGVVPGILADKTESTTRRKARKPKARRPAASSARKPVRRRRAA